jgi:hypothetical protein
VSHCFRDLVATRASVWKQPWKSVWAYVCAACCILSQPSILAAVKPEQLLVHLLEILYWLCSQSPVLSHVQQQSSCRGPDIQVRGTGHNGCIECLTSVQQRHPVCPLCRTAFPADVPLQLNLELRELVALAAALNSVSIEDDGNGDGWQTVTSSRPYNRVSSLGLPSPRRVSLSLGSQEGCRTLSPLPPVAET